MDIDVIGPGDIITMLHGLCEIRRVTIDYSALILEQLQSSFFQGHFVVALRYMAYAVAYSKQHCSLASGPSWTPNQSERLANSFLIFALSVLHNLSYDHAAPKYEYYLPPPVHPRNGQISLNYRFKKILETKDVKLIEEIINGTMHWNDLDKADLALYQKHPNLIPPSSVTSVVEGLLIEPGQGSITVAKIQIMNCSLKFLDTSSDDAGFEETVEEVAKTPIKGDTQKEESSLDLEGQSPFKKAKFDDVTVQACFSVSNSYATRGLKVLNVTGWGRGYRPFKMTPVFAVLTWKVHPPYNPKHKRLVYILTTA
ncbi:hypothetical protein DFH05DRAFT_1560140 [Lentinula detonsa]|uniref:Uncharacterized protein n=1 Tax=Lentinula detonsa TaxID=2804962 RepID=A0A9W8NRW5_9AGAR|nr:hypothetical protein DFH05DRAFT_1560140 [Lentinula detonsa]